MNTDLLKHKPVNDFPIVGYLWQMGLAIYDNHVFDPCMH